MTVIAFYCEFLVSLRQSLTFFQFFPVTLSYIALILYKRKKAFYSINIMKFPMDVLMNSSAISFRTRLVRGSVKFSSGRSC